jgi:hypothetical protein
VGTFEDLRNCEKKERARNSVIFLAADKTRLQDLDEAVRKFLAWESILNEKDKLDLSPHQVKQADTQRTAADGAVTARLPETYQWLLVPTQASPQAPVVFKPFVTKRGTWSKRHLPIENHQLR